MTKRKTKAQREGEQYAALLQRVTDIYSGALGIEWTADEWATADTLSRIIPALKELFSVETAQYVWSPGNLRYFDTAENAAKFLYESGSRA